VRDAAGNPLALLELARSQDAGFELGYSTLALCMSEKTVEAHLSRIYRKLGVRNRAELAGRATRP
jgi:hypothetical protein